MGTLPTSERQTRPLANLEPEMQREVWQEAVQTAPAGRVTAAHVQEVVKVKTRTTDNTITDKPEGASKPEDNESETLGMLKIWWRRANKRDRKKFVEWANDNFNI